MDGELPLPDLPLLTASERSCLSRYITLVDQRLRDNLLEVIIFGSVARGESWPRGMPIRSDLDVLVVTDMALDESVIQELVDATFPLFLECGRQIGPQFRTAAQLHANNESARTFHTNVTRDGIRVYRRAVP
jgi:predicted nucleotidyltransferase